jgi:hypothetical protein
MPRNSALGPTFDTLFIRSQQYSTRSASWSIKSYAVGARNLPGMRFSLACFRSSAISKSERLLGAHPHAQRWRCSTGAVCETGAGRARSNPRTGEQNNAVGSSGTQLLGIESFADKLSSGGAVDPLVSECACYWRHNVVGDVGERDVKVACLFVSLF